ncbi:conserved hypothetical protein [Histoplasma capsulatum G186AR]|uniref:Uncharacterized protein n=1 Tax=Ajellomyces capsulatus (strain G186AR / H82 / ATCC MYA-2454 / RMSCC 2432) TaxID=447093 RepID=C0NEL9_AJECG|nr:uncharacterized protein HCBG_01335 [Histoplasma capsulatum G186AR]EEH09690.1 conserved hypothetical protein [Histoplasma capsulatum G186AR]
MESAVFDDNMEVASDVGHGHPGTIDDIEIDLDFTQVRVPEQDNDVPVDDASAAASDHPPADIDAKYDADMADDEYMEGDMLASGYDQYHQGYYQFDEDSAYNNPMDYEAKMEEDYEEDIDAPIPNSDFEDTNIPIAEEVEEERKAKVVAQEAEVEEEEVEIEEVAVADNTKMPAPEAISHSDQVETEISNNILVAEERLVAQEDSNVTLSKPERLAAEEGNDVFQAVESTEASHLIEGHEKYAEDVEPSLEDGHEHSQTEPEAQTPRFQEPEIQEPESEGRYRSPSGQENLSNTTETYHFVEAQDYEAPSEAQSESREFQERRSLHPVKVLYQDSEISLFPPADDDPTETFFLQDEGVANAPIKELVGACRQVLGEHVSEDEELILDIETLGLHLPECSGSEITTSLSQIIQVYLELCSNDGISEPEPLYLTLSSRSTFTSGFARLVAAAHEGRGLSYLVWEGYDVDNAEKDAEHGVEDGEAHEQPLSTTEAASSPAEQHPHHVEPADEGLSSDNVARSPWAGSTGHNSTINFANQGSPALEEPEFPAPADENEQETQADIPTEVASRGNTVSPQNVEEYSDNQHDQSVDEGKEEVGEYEGDEHDDIPPESGRDDASYHRPTPPLSMKIPTVDLSRDESTEQSEDYVQGYEFNHVPPQLEAKGKEDTEVEYQHGDVGLESKDDQTESHTVSLDNVNGSDTNAQSSTNKDVHIEIDLGTDHAILREGSFSHHSDNSLDEGEIYEPGEDAPETENRAVPILNDGEQPVSGLVVKSPTGDAPRTPELTHDFFEIDEDLFKSPMVDAHEAIAVIGSPAAPLDGADQEPLSYPGGAESYPAESPNPKQDETTATTARTVVGDFDETTISSDKAVPDTDESIVPVSPKSTKRSFIDSGIGDLEGSTPDIKRHRSE